MRVTIPEIDGGDGGQQASGLFGIHWHRVGTQPTPHRGQVGADEALEQSQRHRKVPRRAAGDTLPGLSALLDRAELRRQG
jgi:hypothetical protein